MRMYHGTTRKAAKRIVKSGVLLSGSCFTPNRRAAEHFAYDGGCVVAFDVDPSEIMIDLEIGKWLDLDAANFCNGTPDDTIEDYISRGASFAYAGNHTVNARILA